MPDTEVLVIDTNQLSRRVLEEELNSCGCKTILASSAKEDLDMASSIDPDFITLDITLDDMSGLDLLSKLKTLGATKTIPAMVVTGFEDTIQKEQFLMAGAVEVLYKPFKRGQVASRINNHLSHDGQENSRNILIVEDSGTIRAITKHLLEKQGHTAVEASDGKEGWDELLSGGQDIDMLVTDINMPNMDGRELVKLIRG